MNNQSQTAAPGIWIAFYDPSYNITELLPSGEAYILEIDANSRTVVNIGLQYYEYLTKRPRYIYGKQILECYSFHSLTRLSRCSNVCSAESGFSLRCRRSFLVSLQSQCRDTDSQFHTDYRKTGKEIPLVGKSRWTPIPGPPVRDLTGFRQEVIAEAGSYFALVQFLSWIISGAAWVGDP